MSKAIETFAVNTYSYTLEWSALDCVNHLADLGYRGVELMVYPGHLWPADMDQVARREFKTQCKDRGVRLISTNCPNIDLVVFGKTKALTGAWPRREDFQYSQGPGTTAPTP